MIQSHRISGCVPDAGCTRRHAVGRQRKIYGRHKIFAALVLFALVLLPVKSIAQEKSDAVSPWPESMNQILGIRPDSRPHDGTIGYSFSATVIDAQRLAGSGLSGVKNGDRLKFTHLGDGQWRIKHYVTGFAIVLDFNPPQR